MKIFDLPKQYPPLGTGSICNNCTNKKRGKCTRPNAELSYQGIADGSVSVTLCNFYIPRHGE